MERLPTLLVSALWMNFLLPCLSPLLLSHPVLRLCYRIPLVCLLFWNLFLSLIYLTLPLVRVFVGWVCLRFVLFLSTLRVLWPKPVLGMAWFPISFFFFFFFYACDHIACHGHAAASSSV